MSLAPGTRLGAYEMAALLGGGGIGEVYRADGMRLDRTNPQSLIPNPRFGS